VPLSSRLAATLLFAIATAATAAAAQTTPAQKMAATVLQQRPIVPSPAGGPAASMGYEEGVLLDGLAAEWHVTADGADFAYIKSAVDKYVTADGTVRGFKPDAHTLDDIEMGRAVLLVYRVTQEAKYAKAAKFLHDQLAQQPRTASGGYWHKQIYPNQMWLDGAYMAEPFRAAYAATFQQPADFDDIAKQLLLMDEHMRDPQNRPPSPRLGRVQTDALGRQDHRPQPRSLGARRRMVLHGARRRPRLVSQGPPAARSSW
jgi:unsaturated rhamnogalacturonyl hydrolase